MNDEKSVKHGHPIKDLVVGNQSLASNKLRPGQHEKDLQICALFFSNQNPNSSITEKGF